MSFNQMESKKRLAKLKNSIDSKIRQTSPTLTQSVKTLVIGYDKLGNPITKFTYQETNIKDNLEEINND